jgi:hypothetical protein
MPPTKENVLYNYFMLSRISVFVTETRKFGLNAETCKVCETVTRIGKMKQKIKTKF